MQNDLDAGSEAPSASESPQAPEVPGGATRVAYLIGGTGLFVAMATDAVAVLGRHTGFTLLGSIEVVQCCIVLIASSAMIFATLKGSHAAVHILTERLSAPTVQRLARVSAALAAVLFLVLAGAGLWLIHDLWGGHERTELLHIPITPLRLLQVGALLFIAALFLRSLFRRSAP
jgi:TRAP-type C4-dicarboxylate transport system permease small subunit